MAHPSHGNQGISSRVAVEDGGIYTGVRSRHNVDNLRSDKPYLLEGQKFQLLPW